MAARKEAALIFSETWLRYFASVVYLRVARPGILYALTLLCDVRRPQILSSESRVPLVGVRMAREGVAV